MGDDSVTGDLITLKELETLGCTVPSAYEWKSDSSAKTCTNSPYKSWLVNSQLWWTRSAFSTEWGFVWCANYKGSLDVYYYADGYGVRPVITISKETLKGL